MNTPPPLALALMRKGKRALAVAALGLLLGVVVVPPTSLAQPVPHVQHAANIDHPADGSGDSPVMP